jgi:hypothetical protein
MGKERKNPLSPGLFQRKKQIKKKKDQRQSIGCLLHQEPSRIAHQGKDKEGGFTFEAILKERIERD